jgi:hypothetical protein
MSKDLRTELLALLLSMPYNDDTGDFCALVEVMRDHLTDRDGARDPELHRAFQIAMDAVAERYRGPLGPDGGEFASR